MKRDAYSEKLSGQAAHFLKRTLKPSADSIGLILGTGWGKRLEVDNVRSTPFHKIQQFTKLPQIVGHERKYSCGTVGGKPVILSGRVHCFERPYNEEHLRSVRLAVDTLLQLGVRKFIVTCAAGSLPGSNLKAGSLMAVDGLLTVLAPQMPTWGPEYCSPEDVLCPDLRALAVRVGEEFPGGVTEGGYAMVHGSYFEGRHYDKKFISLSGVSVVGMSMLPEMLTISLYGDEGAKAVGLAFVTNGYVEKHEHESNIGVADDNAEHLGAYLTRLIEGM